MARPSSKESPAEGFHLEATRVSIFEELLKIASAKDSEASSDVQEAAAAVGSLTAKDMEEIRTMHSPPPILRRTLEATWLLLNAPKVGSVPAPPAWARVQRMLADATFLSRMQCFDIDTLKQSPELSTFVANEYFGAGSSSQSQTAPQRLGSRSSLPELGRRSTFVEAGRRSFSGLPNGLPRSSSKTLVLDEPLTFHRVHRASHAAGALFKWCTTTLVEVMDPEPDRPKEEVLSTSAGESDGDSLPSSASKESPPISALPPIAMVAAEKLSAAAAVAALNAGAVPADPAPAARPPVAAAALRTIVKPKAPPRLVLTAATPPDRHFELLAVFVLGNAGLPLAAEATLQTVASTICMRPSLSLELEACPDRIEHDALSRTRVSAVQDWFADNSIPTSICAETRRFAKPGEEPGVVCRVVLNRDRNLRDYFIVRENPQEDDDIAFSRDVARDALMLETDFSTCRH